MKLFDTIAAMLDLHAAEIRTGITVVKAVALDKRLADLSKVGDPAELLDIAIEAGKLGLREADLEPMARLWYMTKSRGVTEADIRAIHLIIRKHQEGHQTPPNELYHPDRSERPQST